MGKRVTGVTPVFPPSGRGFAGSRTPNPRRGAGLGVSGEGRSTWQPQGWESSGGPAWSFPTLPLRCPRHSPGIRGARLRLWHPELAVSNGKESKRRMSSFSARELARTGRFLG